MADKKGQSRPKNIATLVDSLIRQTVEQMGYILWDVDYSKEGVDWNLTVFIDLEQREIGIDDCVKVHHAIDPIIDREDPIKDFYYLQVSSPGTQRELKKPEHFRRFIGREIDVKFFAPQDFDGAKLKSVRAVLQDCTDKTITINYEGKIFELDKATCATVRSVE